MQVQPFSIVPNRVQQNAFSDSDDEQVVKQKRLKIDSSRRSKSTKNRSRKSTSKNSMVKPNVDDNDYDENSLSKPKRLSKRSNKSSASKPTSPRRKLKRGKKSKQAQKPPDSPKLTDDIDEPYVQVLQIPDFPYEGKDDLAPLKSVIDSKSKTSKKKKNKRKDSYPNFPSKIEGGDGMMPLETMAETTEIFTNAFRTDKYEGAVSRRKPAPEADLSQPVPGWLPFQVPIVPHPNDVEFEREATKQYDLTKLLHKAKSC